MKQRFVLWALFAVVATLVATAVLYGSLPDRVPTHWNVYGRIDHRSDRPWIFGVPLVLTLLALLWTVLPKVSPRKFDVESFSDTWWFGGMILVGLLASVQGVILWGARSGNLDIGRALVIVVSVCILLLGNVMGKLRRNFWLGVRTPWTLADERVWYATHRLAGKTMVGGALLALAVALAGLPLLPASILLALGAVAPAPYSLFAYRRIARTGAG